MLFFSPFQQCLSVGGWICHLEPKLPEFMSYKISDSTYIVKFAFFSQQVNTGILLSVWAQLMSTTVNRTTHLLHYRLGETRMADCDGCRSGPVTLNSAVLTSASLKIQGNVSDGDFLQAVREGQHLEACLNFTGQFGQRRYR